jgi:RHS repeat-associated protein
LSQGQASSQYVWSGQPTTTANFTHDQLNRDAAMAAASGYDANGNLISDGVRTFTYDAENRLTGVTGGTTSVTLAYDPWGRLSSTTAGGSTTMFANSGDQLVGELQQSTTGPGPSSSLRDYIYAPGGELLGWHGGGTANTALNWFHTDRQGSVVATSDALSAVTAYTYGPYGEPQSWAGSRFRYTGQMAIPEAQLYHYRARAYDPMMGRFLQTDPIRYGDGGNIYAYTHGDPVNGTDPTGFSQVDELTVTGFPLLQIPPLSFADMNFAFSFPTNIGNINLNGTINIGNINIDLSKVARNLECFLNQSKCDQDLPANLRANSVFQPRSGYVEDALRVPNVQSAAEQAIGDTKADGNEHGFWAIPNRSGGYDIVPRPEGNSQNMDEGPHLTSPYGDVIWFHVHPVGADPNADGADKTIESTIVGVSAIISAAGYGVTVIGH